MEEMTPDNLNKHKVLLMVLPYWTPLLPMLGISSIKSYLQENGVEAFTIDSNVDEDFLEMHDKYFNLLEGALSDDKVISKNHILNIGHNVMQNHMMAYINKKANEKDYFELLDLNLREFFFIEPSNILLTQLNEIVTDFFLKLDHYIEQIIKEHNPTVLGLSVFNHTLPASIFTFRLIKERYPYIRLTMGGGVFSTTLPLDSPNLSSFLDEMKDIIDKIFVGPSEVAFLKYLQGEFEDEKIILTNQKKDCQFDINKAPLPDFGDFDLEKFPYLASYGSVGCPFKCSFCSETVLWGGFREKYPEKIVSDMKALSERHDYQLFWMCDSLVNPFATELAREIIEKDYSLYWDGYFRVDKKAEKFENCLLWRRGGMYKARLGVESGSQKVLNLMDKRITVDMIRKSLRNLAEAGIKTTTYWILGYPGETEEDFQMTLDLITELKDYIYEVMCEPFYYNHSGQVKSEEWLKDSVSRRLFPEKFKDMLLTETWIMDCNPPRETIFKRLRQFVDHCNNKLGIPTPYTIRELCKADERWMKLHPNAVPPLINFMYEKNIEENKAVPYPILNGGITR
ncbi:B12-binding domain-containing radical SAM protein [Paenibacillus typhae]|uniref:B12-binding domain-containing radical SAM protein n=1 Tax=Paenibacillus typhae TaxID=1174501 RepID=UPI001C8EFC05|nr:radical SAM protein [Paenibacillus typhae]MBY0012816.1 radical SAM protein [Paenibacillus typhae]